MILDDAVSDGTVRGLEVGDEVGADLSVAAGHALSEGLARGVGLDEGDGGVAGEPGDGLGGCMEVCEAMRVRGPNVLSPEHTLHRNA